MKTINNVPKTTLKNATLFLIVLLVTFSQVFGSKNLPKSGIKSILVVETATDEKMDIENWMTDESNFTLKFEPVPAVERPIQIEDRMTNDKLFASATAALEPAVEEKMDIENWMTDENLFNPKVQKPVLQFSNENIELWKVKQEKYGNRLFILTQVKDKKIEIESWMVNKKYW